MYFWRSHIVFHKLWNAKFTSLQNSRKFVKIFIFLQKLQLENVVPLDCCRLVLYNSQQDAIEDCFENKEMMDIGTICDMVFIACKCKPEMLIDIRDEDTPFYNYKNGGKLNMRVLWF